MNEHKDSSSKMEKSKPLNKQLESLKLEVDQKSKKRIFSQIVN